MHLISSITILLSNITFTFFAKKVIFIVKYYNILRKQWNEYASKARDIAKHIVTGAEESRETHARWSKVIDYLDVLATSALNEKYANDGSKSSIHTYSIYGDNCSNSSHAT